MSGTSITFAQFQSPGLQDDTYTITARVKPQGDGAPQFDPVTKVVEVGTDDESIPVDAIVSTFPADGVSGDFTGVTPHVVLKYPSLPWRKPMPGGTDATPWLAVLVLTAGELAGAGVTVTKPPAPTLTLPASLFAEVAPTLAELAFLAHVRRVDTAATPDAAEQETDYAVVVGARMPPATASSLTAFLVPLNKVAGQLPGAAASGAADVTLPILASWRFFPQANPPNFAAIVSAVDCTPGGLALPNAQAGDAVALGYLPLAHALRVGGQTVSWYRGPCAPYPVARQAPKPPIATADQVTFYDPTTGMMDVSCSAAWTLGRLMALNATSYATALYNWKRATARATLEAAIYELDTGKPMEAIAAPRRSAAERGLAEKLPAAFERLAQGDAVAPRPRRRALRSVRAGERARRLHRAMTDVSAIADRHAPLGDDASDPNLALVLGWLADRMLLKGVPLPYLIPDERMLKAESIRFFRIDPAWLTALIDGALSLGRITAADQAHDAALHAHVTHAAARLAASARARRRGQPAEAEALADDDPYALPRPASGFFLRSSAVSTWPTMQVDAWDAGGAAATILRLETSGALLTCLFDRPVTRVALHPPTEGLHFGYGEDTKGALVKKRRRLATDTGGPIGKEIDTGPLGPPPMRAASADGVIDVASLASQLAASFQLPPAQFTSAEFALQMIAGVEEVEFDLPAA